MAKSLGGDYYAERDGDRIHLFTKCEVGFDVGMWLDREVAEKLKDFIEAGKQSNETFDCDLSRPVSSADFADMYPLEVDTN